MRSPIESCNAIVDSKVKCEYDKLQSAFDSRLDENASGLLASYDNDEALHVRESQTKRSKSKRLSTEPEVPSL